MAFKRVMLKWAAVAAVLSIAGFAFLNSSSRTTVDASASGPSATFTGAPFLPYCPTCPKENTCTACHAGSPPNSGPGSVSIAGLPANYLPNQTIPVTVTTADPNAVIYGFQMVAIDRLGRNSGTISVRPANPQPIQVISGSVNGNERRYVEHTQHGVVPTQAGLKSWTFDWTAPATRIGMIRFYAAGNGANSDGSSGGDEIYTTSNSTATGTATSNFDTDGLSDIAVYRPSNGTWYSLLSKSPAFTVFTYGQAGDLPAPADYNADGKTDAAVFRPSNGTWYIRFDDTHYRVQQFGESGDVPIAKDFDGDLVADLAVWRPSNSTFYIQGSASGFRAVQFGQAGDKPVPADFDADGKADIAVWRPSNGTWYYLTSGSPGYIVIPFGVNGDIPVQSDYDGDGKADLAVFRPSNGTWYFQNSLGFSVQPFGQTGDVPSPADYDGDGRTDISVFRNGTFYFYKSYGPVYSVAGFGAAGDIPVATAELPIQ